MEMNAIVMNVLIGMGAGLVYAVTGYLKGASIEKFDGQKFFTTAVLGLIVGGVSGYYDVSLMDAMNILLAFGLIAVIENVCKIIYRRLAGSSKAKPKKKVVKKDEDEEVKDEEE